MFVPWENEYVPGGCFERSVVEVHGEVVTTVSDVDCFPESFSC